MYRELSEEAAVAEAYRRAQVAYVALVQRRVALVQANAELLRHHEAPQPLTEYLPPPVPAPGFPAAALIRQLDDLFAYYTYEGRQQDAFLARVARTQQAAVRSTHVLGPAPRPVPLVYRMAEFWRGYWLVLRFLLFPPFAMLASVPLGFLGYYVEPGFIGIPLGVVGLGAFVRYRRRVRLLARAEVPTVLARTISPTGSYSKNWPMLQADGWKVGVSAYTGRTVVTELTYRTSAGVIGKARVRGPEFHGTILALPDGAAALPNLAFASAPEPDERGQWVGRLPGRVWFTTLLAVLMVLAASIVIAAWSIDG